MHPISKDRLNSWEEEWCLPMPGEQITCREFVGFVGDYRDSELPAAARSLFQAHLAKCQKCQEYLNSYGATIRLARAAMKDFDEQTVPEEFVNAILTAFSQRK